MRRLLDWLRQEPALKLISLLIAIALWAWRSSEANPDEERKFPNLPVTVVNLPRDLTVVNEPPTVSVALYGPRRTLVSLQQRGEVQPSVDLAGIDAPTWRSIEVEVDVPDNVEVRSVDPDRWEVEIDRYQTGAKSIRPDLGDSSPPAGYLSEPPRLSTETAHVRGARKRVNRVAFVAAPISLAGRTDSFTETVRLRPVDSAGQLVSGIEVTPKDVEVSVNVARIEETRKLRVVVPIDNEPAAGYVLSGYEVTPPTVIVNGSSSALARLGDALATMPIDVAGQRAAFWRDVPLALTPGVVAEPSTVRVLVKIRRAGS